MKLSVTKKRESRELERQFLLLTPLASIVLASVFLTHLYLKRLFLQVGLAYLPIFVALNLCSRHSCLAFLWVSHSGIHCY